METTRAGGMTRYPPDRLREEVAYVAFHFHWQLTRTSCSSTTANAQRWVTEIARLNERINDAAPTADPCEGGSAMTSAGVPLGLSWAPAVLGNWVPGVRPLEPFVVFNFAVEIEGLLVGGFTEVSGLESRIETIDHREGGVNGYAAPAAGFGRARATSCCSTG